MMYNKYSFVLLCFITLVLLIYLNIQIIWSLKNIIFLFIFMNTVSIICSLFSQSYKTIWRSNIKEYRTLSPARIIILMAHIILKQIGDKIRCNMWIIVVTYMRYILKSGKMFEKTLFLFSFKSLPEKSLENNCSNYYDINLYHTFL